MADRDIPTDEQLRALAKEILAERPPGTEVSFGEKDGGIWRYLSILLEAEIDGPSKLQ